MKTIHIHFGYPKCLSTTLQRCIFNKHPQIKYGGIGKHDNISYTNESIEILFESILKYSNEHYYQFFKKEHQKHIDDFINNSEKSKIVFSSEHLSMNFTLQGIDSRLKYDRIKSVFSDYPIGILLIKRNPVSLIRSLYGEFVRMGYFGYYEEFLKWLIMTHDRNFLYDLNYERKEIQIKETLTNADITWLDFEEIIERGVQESLNLEIGNWLDIDNLNLETPNENIGLTSDEISKLNHLNVLNRRELGLSQLEPFERHRNKAVFRHLPIEMTEPEIFSNVIAKRKAMARIESLQAKEVNYLSDEANALEDSVLKIISKI